MILNPVEDFRLALREQLDELFANVGQSIENAFYWLAEQLQHGSNIFIKEMLDFVLYTPTIAGDPIVDKIWNIVRTISFSLVGVMFVWEGFKKGISSDLIRTVEFKQMFIRMIYGIILSVFSLDLIDILINFNEALVMTMKDNFTIQINNDFNTVGIFSTIMTMILLVVQIVIGVKLILQYWMRIAELWFMAVVGPVMYTLWINPNWAGYLGSWFRRLTSTIFTTFAWSILIAIYSALVSMVASAGMLVGYPTLGPVAGMCLSIALLLVMIETPSFLREFMHSHDSALKLAKNNITQAVRAVKTPIIRVSGWLKPKTV